MARRIVLRSDDTPSRPSEDALTLDYRDALNPQQHAVVTADPGAVLVVAGPAVRWVGVVCTLRRGSHDLTESLDLPREPTNR